jgi:hypothetical protein
MRILTTFQLFEASYTPMYISSGEEPHSAAALVLWGKADPANFAGYLSFVIV